MSRGDLNLGILFPKIDTKFPTLDCTSSCRWIRALMHMKFTGCSGVGRWRIVGRLERVGETDHGVSLRWRTCPRLPRGTGQRRTTLARRQASTIGNPQTRAANTGSGRIAPISVAGTVPPRAGIHRKCERLDFRYEWTWITTIDVGLGRNGRLSCCSSYKVWSLAFLVSLTVLVESMAHCPFRVLCFSDSYLSTKRQLQLLAVANQNYKQRKVSQKTE